MISIPLAKAKRVRAVRMLTGLKRLEIQRKYGIHENTIKSWEKPAQGSKGLSKKGAERLLAFLRDEGVHCSINWLLTGLGEGPRLINNTYKIQAKIAIPEVEIEQEIAILKEVQFFLDINKEATVLLITDQSMIPLYQLGDYVGGYRKTGEKIQKLVGTDCIVELKDNTKLVCQFFFTKQEGIYRISQLNMLDEKRNSKDIKQQIKSAAAIIWHRKKCYI